MLTGAGSQALTFDPGASGLVSPIVAKVILENRPLLASDFTQPVPGIVLCADLSGFSMAGAALTRSEARGAEQLQGIVNAVFTRVTEAIQTGGGTILQFSGDAMTAVWPANGPSPHQALRAIAAGLALQSACRNLSVAEMTGLRMRAALSQGQAWIAHLTEGAESPETVICGDVFDAFRDAGGFRDGVVLDENLWHHVSSVIGPRATVVPDGDGVMVVRLTSGAPTADPAPDHTADEAVTVATYLPAYLRTLLAGVGSEWLAEFRSVQILFARFPGFRFRGSDDLPALARLAK